MERWLIWYAIPYSRIFCGCRFLYSWHNIISCIYYALHGCVLVKFSYILFLYQKYLHEIYSSFWGLETLHYQAWIQNWSEGTLVAQLGPLEYISKDWINDATIKNYIRVYFSFISPMERDSVTIYALSKRGALSLLVPSGPPLNTMHTACVMWI